MDSHHRNRKSPRLKDYDYRQKGVYFVTICTHQQKRFFGFIENEVCNLSPLGKIAHDDWAKMPTYYDHIALDAYVIMPNHMHGIIIITKSGQTSLGGVIGAYKAGVTRQARQLGYDMIIWHGRYYDRIIRNEAELHRIRAYILENPARWQHDSYYAE
ncbi:MAG: transposase [Anaerolineae bacterium]|nr:transposase [Anaerolineae bacterium]